MMKTQEKKFKQKTIHKSLVIRYSLLFLAIWILLESFMCLYFYRNYRDTMIQQQTNLADSLSQSTGTAFRSLDNAILNMIYSQQVMASVKQRTRNLYNGDSQSAISESLELPDYMLSARGYDNSISQINYYDMQDNCIGAGLQSGPLILTGNTPDWMKEIRSLDRVISPLHHYSWIHNYPDDTPRISVCRLFTEKGAFVYGVLEASETADLFFHYLNEAKTDASRLYLLNQNGDLLYPFIKSIQTPPGDPGLPAGISTFEEKGDIVTFVKNSDWTLILCQTKKELFGPFYTTQFAMLGILMAGLAILLLSSYYVARQVTAPLWELTSELDSVNLNNVTLNSNRLYIDSEFHEITQIVSTYNDMYDRLSKAIKREILAREEEANAQLLAVQTQMNPHFLYNNLTNISVMAEDGMNSEIVQMCSDISFMLRYTSAKSISGVTIMEEMEHVNRYFNCLKIRYDDKLLLQTNLSPAILGKMIPKLVIQPLVENISKYGFGNQPPWVITITGHETGDSWYIDVMDNGKGFSSESLDQLLHRFQDFDENLKLPPMQIKGMGLLNIYIRMRLFFRERLIFELKNMPQGGSRVRIGCQEKGTNA